MAIGNNADNCHLRIATNYTHLNRAGVGLEMERMLKPESA
jgi:hypothetical protein